MEKNMIDKYDRHNLDEEQKKLLEALDKNKETSIRWCNSMWTKHMIESWILHLFVKEKCSEKEIKKIEEESLNYLNRKIKKFEKEMNDFDEDVRKTQELKCNMFKKPKRFFNF